MSLDINVTTKFEHNRGNKSLHENEILISINLSINLISVYIHSKKFFIFIIIINKAKIERIPIIEIKHDKLLELTQGKTNNTFKKIKNDY